MRHITARSMAGFTLLEILVALILFAAVGGSLLALFQQGLRATHLATDHAHAAMLARSKLTELQAYAVLEPGIYEGAFDDRYRWQVLLTEDAELADAGTLPLRPMQLKLEVSWGEGPELRSVGLNSLLLTSGGTP